MCAQRGRMVTGRGILPIGLARADGIEEMAKVRERRLRAFVLEMLRRFPGRLAGSTSVAITLGSL
jgi:hypothetical protein